MRGTRRTATVPTGRRRLRIPVVGEVRRRRASYTQSTSFMDDVLDPKDGSIGQDDVQWLTLQNVLRESSDPLYGMRAHGSVSRFWTDGDTLDDDLVELLSNSDLQKLELQPGQKAARYSVSVQGEVESVPEVTYLRSFLGSVAEKREEGLLSQPELPKAQKTLHASVQNIPKVPQTTMQVSYVNPVAVPMHHSDRVKPWRGPLPPRRISPPLTLSDCIGKTNGRSRHPGRLVRPETQPCHRSGSPTVGSGFQNSNSFHLLPAGK